MLYEIDFDKHNKTYYRRATAPLFENYSVVEIGYNTIPQKAKQVLKRDVYIIHYVTSGQGTFMSERFQANQCYFVSEGELEIIEANLNDSYECYWIMLKGENAKEILSNCGLPDHNSVFSFEYTDECSKIINQYLFHESYENDFAEACKLEELMYKLLSYHIKNKSHSSKTDLDLKVKAIADYIENNYRNDIKISDLCKIFYFSKNYLCTIFKNKYGMTPKEYLIWYRLSIAKELLMDNECVMSVSEISAAVGISNALYFTRLFHNKEGITPSEYRKQKHKT